MDLRVEGDCEFGGELFGVKGAASEVAPVQLDGGHLAQAAIHAEDQLFGVGILVHVDLLEGDAAFP